MPHDRIESTINLAMGMRKNGGPVLCASGFLSVIVCSFGIDQVRAVCLDGNLDHILSVEVKTKQT